MRRPAWTVAVMALGFAVAASGQTSFTNNATGNWSDGGVWAGGVAPNAGGSHDYALIFTNNAVSSSTNDLSNGGVFALNSLIMAGSGQNMTLSPSAAGNVLVLTNNGSALPQVINSSTKTLTNNHALFLSADTLFIGGNIAGDTFTLNGPIGGTGMLIYSNSASGTGNLRVSGANNSFSGGTYVRYGRLVYGATNCLGTGDIVITNNGQIYVAGGAASTITNTIYISGTGNTENRGAIRLENGTIDGRIILTGNARINGNGAARIISGAITEQGGPFELEFGGVGNADLTLTASNSFSGGAKLSQGGTLSVSNDNALGTGTLTFNGAGLAVLGRDRTLANPVVLAANASIGAGFNLTLAGTVDLGTTTRTLTINNMQTTLSGSLTNTAGLTKAGTGALVLGGSNTYGGLTTVSAGTLSIANSGALPGWDTAGRYSVANGGALAIGNALSDDDLDTMLATGNFAAGAGIGFDTTEGDRIYARAITNDGILGLAKVGPNTLTLTGTNTYTGTTAIYGGRLMVSNATDRVMTNVISGAGILAKSGAGGLGLSGTNTFSGGTEIVQGSVTAAVAAALGTGAVTNHGILNLTAGAVTYSGLSTTLAGSGTNNVTLGTGTGTTILNGNYSGFEGVWNVGVGAAAGAGKVQMNGLDNTGAVINVLANGTVYVAAAVRKNATIYLYGGNTGESLGQLRIEANGEWAGNVVIAGDAVAADSTIGANSGVGYISGSISESGSHALSKRGAGTVVLSGSNTYSGGTVLYAGTLSVSNDNALGTGPITLSGGTLAVLGQDRTYANSMAMGANSTIGAGSNLTVSGAVDLGTANRTLTINNLVTTLSGPLTNTAGLTKGGPGVLQLLGTNTYGGNTTNSAGVLSIGTTDALPGWNTAGRYWIAANAALAVGNAVTDGEVNAILATGNFASGGGIGFDTTAGDRIYGNLITGTVAGVLGLAKAGPNTLVLSNAANRVKWIMMNGGVLDLARDVTLGTDGTFGIMGDGGTVNSSGGRILLAYGTDANAEDWKANAGRTITINAVIADDPAPGAGIDFYNSGTIVLGGANTYGGRNLFAGTTVSVTNIGNAGAASNLGTNKVLRFGNAAVAGTLVYTGPGETSDKVISLTGTTNAGGAFLDQSGAGLLKFTSHLTYANGVANSTRTLTLQGSTAGEGEIAGVIADQNLAGAVTTAVTKAGSGKWTLSGANTYSGETIFSDGILAVSNVADYGVASSLGARTLAQENNSTVGISLHFRGGTLQFTGTGAQSLNRQIRVSTAGGTIDASGPTADDTIFFSWSGPNTNFWDTTGARTLTLTGGNTGTNTFAINIQNQAASATALMKTGDGTWLITNPHNGDPGPGASGSYAGYSGGTTLSGGRLGFVSGALGSAGTIGFSNSAALLWLDGNSQDLSGRIRIEDGVNATFDTGINDVTFGSALQLGAARSGGLTKAGIGTLTLAGANAYGGTTTIGAGTLAIGVAGSISNSAVIDVRAGATLALPSGGYAIASNQTLKGRGTVTGGLIMGSGSKLAPGSSPGTMTVSNDLTFTSGSELAIELNGTGAEEYDQLLLAGAGNALTLGGATLTVHEASGLALGAEFRIVRGYNNALVPGDAFAGGATVLGANHGTEFSINYVADDQSGDGKDIMLTVVPEPTTLGILGFLATALLIRRRLRR